MTALLVDCLAWHTFRMQRANASTAAVKAGLACDMVVTNLNNICENKEKRNISGHKTRNKVVVRSKKKKKMEPSASCPPAVLTKEGWLYKKGRIHKNWKRRWMVLRGPLLYYFAQPHLKEVRKEETAVVPVNCESMNDTRHVSFLSSSRALPRASSTWRGPSSIEQRGCPVCSAWVGLLLPRPPALFSASSHQEQHTAHRQRPVPHQDGQRTQLHAEGRRDKRASFLPLLLHFPPPSLLNMHTAACLVQDVDNWLQMLRRAIRPAVSPGGALLAQLSCGLFFASLTN